MHEGVLLVAEAINLLLICLPEASSLFKRLPVTELPKFPCMPLPDADGKFHLTQEQVDAFSDWYLTLRKKSCGGKWLKIVDKLRYMVHFSVLCVLYFRYMKLLVGMIKGWRSPSVPTPTASQVCPEQVQQPPPASLSKNDSEFEFKSKKF